MICQSLFSGIFFFFFFKLSPVEILPRVLMEMVLSKVTTEESIQHKWVKDFGLVHVSNKSLSLFVLRFFMAQSTKWGKVERGQFT